MYLWAVLFSAAVVSLSVVRTRLVVFVVATAVAVLALLPGTMPRQRPWRLFRRRHAIAAAARHRTAAVTAHRRTASAASRATAPAASRGTAPAGPVLNGVSSSGPSPALPHDQFPGHRLPLAGRLPSTDAADPFAPAYPADPLAPPPQRDTRPW
jgi:hypothetical protein